MITQKLIKLCNAMAEVEGWKPDGNFEKQAKFPSVAYRNHNPGNLRSSPMSLGQRDGFAYFYNDATGMFAMQWDIMKKCKGETTTTLSGDSTISDLILIYSCSTGDEFNNYVKRVCEMTGLEPFTQLKEIIK
jgi:hypothetical protein